MCQLPAVDLGTSPVLAGPAARAALHAGFVDGRGERGDQRGRRRQQRAGEGGGGGGARVAGHAAAQGGTRPGRHVGQLQR